MSRELNRVNEAVQLAKALNSLMEEMSHLETTIEAASSTLEDLRNNRDPDTSKLDLLKLGTLTGFALKMRLQGLLQVKQSRLHELKSDFRRDVDILRKISVCPYCEGSGKKQTHRYERSDQTIYRTVQMKTCERCGGTGRVELGPEITRIIEMIRSRIDEETSTT